MSGRIIRFGAGGVLAAILIGLGVNYYAGQTLGDLFDIVTPNAEVSGEEADRIYRENRAALMAGYGKGDNAIAAAYADWGAGADFPAKPGVHSNRYMMTYVNAIGLAAYTAYESTGAQMPIGTQIAKESFMLKGEGKFRPSPLFTMEKVGLEAAPETGGWRYGRVNAHGRKMPTSEAFCHSCHEAFAGQDSLGYPVRTARVGYTPPDEDAAPAERVAGDITRGRDAFANCASCHTVGDGASNAFGPVLNGIVGRQAGIYPGYGYSSDLKAAGETGLVWTEERLFEWLAGPSAFLNAELGKTDASSKMPISFDDVQFRSDVIAYLKTETVH